MKRPRWVWLISSFYISAGLWGLLSCLDMMSGGKPLPPSVLAHFENYSALDWGLVISVRIFDVIVGVLFLLLRKASVYVFGFKFVYGVALTLREALTRGAMDASTAERVLPAAILWSVSAAVVFYALHLMRKGVLK